MRLLIIAVSIQTGVHDKRFVVQNNLKFVRKSEKICSNIKKNCSQRPCAALINIPGVFTGDITVAFPAYTPEVV